MGLAFASDLHEGFYGLDAFRGSPQTNLRAIGLVFTGVVHLITHRDSGIRTVEGLAGKRVAVGTPGSGTFASAERVFRKLDLWDRMTRVPLLGATAGAALSEGRVDAFFWTGPYPDRVSIEAGLIRPIHFIDAYTPLSRTDFLRVYPYFMKYTIPAGAYPGVTESVPALGIPLLWFVHRDVPADLVQKIVQAAYSRDGHGHMLRVHAASADMTSLKALLGVTIPLHRGAEAHWISVGLEIPERIKAR
jgi:TRAP transporter TAXI family solute receptor